jgi:hypothetical protein
LASKNFAPVSPFFQKKEGTIRGGCVWIVRITYFHSSGSFILTQKQKVNYTSYHHYYFPVPLEGPRATEKGTYDASELEVACTRVHRASASSSVRSVLCPDLSNSSSDFSSGKCNTVATNVERDPQRTPLAAPPLWT